MKDAPMQPHQASSGPQRGPLHVNPILQNSGMSQSTGSSAAAASVGRGYEATTQSKDALISRMDVQLQLLEEKVLLNQQKLEAVLMAPDLRQQEPKVSGGSPSVADLVELRSSLGDQQQKQEVQAERLQAIVLSMENLMLLQQEQQAKATQNAENMRQELQEVREDIGDSRKDRDMLQFLRQEMESLRLRLNDERIPVLHTNITRIAEQLNKLEAASKANQPQAQDQLRLSAVEGSLQALRDAQSQLSGMVDKVLKGQLGHDASIQDAQLVASRILEERQDAQQAQLVELQKRVDAVVLRLHQDSSCQKDRPITLAADQGGMKEIAQVNVVPHNQIPRSPAMINAARPLERSFQEYGTSPVDRFEST